MKPKVAPQTIGPKRFKLTVYYEGEDAGLHAQMDFYVVKAGTYPPDVKVEASWEELTEGQQPER